MTRQRKTPAQRAQEALDVATRIVDRLTKQRDKLQAELESVEKELTDARRRRDYLGTNPDLPPPTPPRTRTQGHITINTPTGDPAA